MSTATKTEETPEKKVTMTQEELDALIAKAKAEGEEKGKKTVPAQGLSANAVENEDFMPRFDIPEGWETFKCPPDMHEDIRLRESIVEPGKPMYKYVSDDPRLTRGSTAHPLILWIRRKADGDAMSAQATRDAQAIVGDYNRTSGVALEGAEGIARTQSIGVTHVAKGEEK